tara:strand:- start:18334 stop:19947 length:1614 start_codon:yes stop_codon:yes gene_type:complete
MFFRLFFLLSLYSFSQIENLNDFKINNIQSDYAFKMNNLGDPLVFFTHFYSYDFNITTSFNINQLTSYYKRIDKNEGVFSHICYEGVYNEGGFLKTYLSRPIQQNINMLFLYNNLSSKGFFNNQHNKYSSLFFSLDFFEKKSPYSLFFSFYSNNGNYQHNGGIVEFDSSISYDLLETNLSAAHSIIKHRKIDLSHHYQFPSNVNLKHEFSYSFFNRNYIDPNSNLLQQDTLKNFFNYIKNNLSFSNKFFSFSLNYLAYKSVHFLENQDDLFMTLKDSEANSYKRNLNYNFSYCPIGHRKNNYQFSLAYKKTTLKNQYFIGFDSYHKKPNLFTVNSFDSLYPNWLNFKPINFNSFKIKNIWTNINLITELRISRYKNYVFLNQLIYPDQLSSPMLFFDLRLEKKWILKNLLIKSSLIGQYSNEMIVSFPNLLIHKQIAYNYQNINRVGFRASLNLYCFSPYYSDLYSPSLDVFYLQFNSKNNFKIYSHFDIFVSKDNFQIGFLFDYLNNIISKDQYLIESYYLPKPNVRLSIKWFFLD